MWHKFIENQVELSVFVKPNAKRTSLLAINDEQGLVIALHAKPHEGEANSELINFLSELFKLPKTSIILRRGNRSRHKKIRVPLNDTVKQLLTNPQGFIVESTKR